MREPIILWEGECAYALQTCNGYEIRMHSSNHVQHVVAGYAVDAETAERCARRLNAYPRQTRQSHGLL